MATPTPEEIQQLARALSDPSRSRIFWHVMASDGPVGVAELTELLGFNHNAIRQHIARLVEARLLVESTEPRDRPGRPRLVYTARDDAIRALGDDSRSYRRVARLLLEVAKSGDDPYEVGKRAASEEGGSLPVDVDAFAVLMHRLTVEGFEPTHADDRIVLNVCPFADVAAEGPSVVCELHRGLIDGYLDAPAQLIARNPHVASCEIRIAS